MSSLSIGTRESALAVAQANYVRSILMEAHRDLQVELRPLRTRGDREQRKPLSELGGTGLFTREIEKALLDGTVDIAVHSLKDLPTEPRGDLLVAAVPVRVDPADALVAEKGITLKTLPDGAAVLTGSPRRKAQLLHHRPDLEVRSVRGNVPTRVRKLGGSDAKALVLACAGLVRLGLEEHIAERLDLAEFLPAPGQGALAVQIRSDDSRCAEFCQAIDDRGSHLAALAERGFLSALGGGCQLPAGAYARFGGDAGHLLISGMIAGPDGSRLLDHSVSAPVSDAEEAAALGKRLADALLVMGGRELLTETRRALPGRSEGS